MQRFLIDVNLPYRFSIWNNNEYLHQNDLGPSWPDNKIWEYARDNDLTIVTKDSDFTNRILVSEPPPKVIHIKIGNLRVHELHSFLGRNWSDILRLNTDNKLVVVRRDRIESIKGHPA